MKYGRPSDEDKMASLKPFLSLQRFTIGRLTSSLTERYHFGIGIGTF
jgi:hypothetical protein